MATYQVFWTDPEKQRIQGGTPPMETDPRSACEALEKGGIIYFPTSPFPLSLEEQSFLLHQQQLESAYHKNIAYRPAEDRVTGIPKMPPQDEARLHHILKTYSRETTQFLTTFLAPYSQHWKLDFASYRPFEEQGRKLRLRARNDLLHVDSFPTRPTYGGRILRVFTNLHPSKVRVWKTSDPFEPLVQQFKGQVAPYEEPRGWEKKRAQAPGFWRNLGKKLGLHASHHSPYDRWMMTFHNYLKENQGFQTHCRQDQWTFPPGSSWMVYTDLVSHAVLSGQAALEQTYIIALEDLVCPETAPLNVLKRMYGAESLNVSQR